MLPSVPKTHLPPLCHLGRQRELHTPCQQVPQPPQKKKINHRTSESSRRLWLSEIPYWKSFPANFEAAGEVFTDLPAAQNAILAKVWAFSGKENVGNEIEHKLFLLKLFGHLRDIPAKSRDIPPIKFDFPGFEGHTELFGPHHFT